MVPGPGDPFAHKIRRRDAIHGTTVQGNAVALLDAWFEGGESTLMAGGIEHWRGRVIVEGEHVTSLPEFAVDDITVEILGLSEWMSGWWSGPPGFLDPPPLIVERRRRTKVRDPVSDAWERRRWRLNRARLKAYHDRARAFSRDFSVELADRTSLTVRSFERQQRTERGHRWVKESLLDVSSPAPRPLEDILARAVDPLVKFLVLALGDQARVERVTVNRRDPIDPFLRPAMATATHLRREVQVYQHPHPKLRRGTPKYERQLLAPRAALGPAVSEVFGRWWRLLERLEPAHTMLFGVWNAHTIYLENMLLNLTSFAEGYHERCFDEPKLDLATHKAAVKRLLRSLPPEFRRAYRPALKYAYRQNQRDRMLWLIERASAWVPAIACDTATLTNQLIDTRNHLTHLGERKATVVEDEALVDVVERLSATLRVSLLIDLGMQPDAVEYGFLARYGTWRVFAAHGNP